MKTKKELSQLEDGYLDEDSFAVIVTEVEYLKSDYLSISERFPNEL